MILRIGVSILRKLKQLVVVLMAVLLVSGCKMKAEYNMAIKKDKSMDLSVIIGMDDEMLNLMLASDEGDDITSGGSDYTDEQKWAYLDESLDLGELKDSEDEEVKVDKYTDDGFKGYKVVFKVKNIDDISGSKGSDAISDLSDFGDKELFIKDGNKYSLKFTINDMKDVAEEAEASSTEGLNMDMSSIFDLKFVISLPDKPIKHNATSVSEDGKTLTWDLMKQGDTPIEVDFELGSGNSNLLLYVSLGALCLAVVIVVIVALIGKKKKGKMEMVMDSSAPMTEPHMTEEANGVPVPPVPPVDAPVEPPVPPVEPSAPAPEGAPVPPVPPVEPAPMPPTPPVPPVEPPKPEEVPVPPVPPVDAPVEPPVPPVEPPAPVPEEVASPVEVPEEPKPEVNE